jgi:hypothetical protein
MFYKVINKVNDEKVCNVPATTDYEQENKRLLIWNVNYCTELSNIPYA